MFKRFLPDPIKKFKLKARTMVGFALKLNGVGHITTGVKLGITITMAT